MMLPRSKTIPACLAVVLATLWFTRLPSNPEVAAKRSLFSQEHVPSPIAATLKSACIDCHSNQTKWPWYAHLPFSSYVLVRDVQSARQHLNFSDWERLKQQGPEQLAAGFSGICENMLSGAMPKPAYLRMHPSARLSKEQVSAVCSWANVEQMQVLRQMASKGDR
jgi:MFS superfamily sulfate permease-like transporter